MAVGAEGGVIVQLKCNCDTGGIEYLVHYNFMEQPTMTYVDFTYFILYRKLFKTGTGIFRIDRNVAMSN